MKVHDVKDKRVVNQVLATKAILFQNQEKNKQAVKSLAMKKLDFQNHEKEKRALELVLANKEKRKRAGKLKLARKALALQNEEKEKRTAELAIAIKELIFQNHVIEKRASELFIANAELIYQNEEKEKRAAEFILANKELAFQNEEKENRAAELIIANKELAFQNAEKAKLAAELVIANKELFYQNHEKEKRAKELFIANEELFFQNHEKETRASELIIANKELAYQNKEKEKRASELTFAYKALAFQHEEKEKYTAELSIANKELLLQNTEKENRALELIGINKKLKTAQEDIIKLNEELESKVITRTAQLEAGNKELEAFSYSVSHDLRSPLRAISGYAKILEEDFAGQIGTDGNKSLKAIMRSAKMMGELIDDLLAFSRLGRKQVSVEELNMTKLIRVAIKELIPEYNRDKIKFNIGQLPPAIGDHSLIKQVCINLISNAIKYSQHQSKSIVDISAYPKGKQIIYSVKDNGVGFDMRYYNKLFGVFQRLHTQKEFEGTGIGLAIVQKIIHRHNGTVWAESKLNEGSTFSFSLSNITCLVT